jgi:hypothetical protein
MNWPVVLLAIATQEKAGLPVNSLAEAPEAMEAVQELPSFLEK